YAKAKEMSASKVREFMQERWSGFVRKGIDAMLLPEDTTYPDDKLKHIAKVISTVPEGVKFVRKAEKILEGRANMVFETNMLDWGMVITLASGSLVEEKNNIRTSGKDVESDTISHRHDMLRDEIQEERINPLNTTPNYAGKLYIYTSIWIEYGVLGL